MPAVPEPLMMRTSFAVPKAVFKTRTQSAYTAPNSALRWLIAWRAIANLTRSGIGTGPGNIRRFSFSMKKIVR